MKKRMMENLQSTRWLAKVSRALIFTLLLISFMHHNDAYADVTVLQAFPNTPTVTAAAQTASGTFTVSAGANRLLLVAVEADSGGTNAGSFTVTYGGQTLTQIVVSDVVQRRISWLGYLNEAQIAAASGTTLAVTASPLINTTPAIRIYASTLAGVDQTTPVSASYSIYDNNTTAVFTYSLAVQAGGYGVFAITANNATLPTVTVDTGYTLTNMSAASPNTNYSFCAAKSYAAAGNANPTITYPATVRGGIAAATINPVLCSDSDVATLTTTNPASSATVNGTVTVQAQVGTETTPAGMTGMAVTITGSTGCNVTGAAMTWNGTSSRWEYSWNTTACGNPTPDTGVAISVTGTDPDCGTVVNAAQITNVTIDNTAPPVLPSTISDCAGCHQYSPTFADGTARNTPMGQFLGSHNAHVINYNCSICHIAPATTTSADFPHRDGTITMNTGSAAINGGYYDKNNNSAYNAGLDNTFAQSNSPVLASCRNVACHSTGIAGATMAAPTWGGGPANCTWCHGDPPTTSPLYNHSGVSAGVCASCHGHDGSGATHADGNLDGTFTCVGCHTSAQGTRAAVVGEFGMAWGHKKSGRGAVVDSDCIVCHLEGVFATQARSATLHGNGNIDLRDPDGVGEVAITNNSGGAFTMTQYAVGYGAGSRTTTLGNTVAEVVTVKFCMKCHDANGATNTTARTNYGTPSATMPFGGVNLGANYTTANGAAAAGGLIDVAKQFLSTNSSRHPVGAPNNRAYPYSTRLAAPYNGLGTARDGNLTTGTAATPRTKANSVIMVCDDCHTTGTALTTRTITAHGSASQIRGTFFVASPTLCTTCHIGVYADNTNGRHNSGSAFAVGTTRANGAMLQCHFCHFSQNEPYAAASRPRYAQDVHGFNELQGTSAGWTAGSANGMRPIAFMRSWATSGGSWPTTASPRPYTATLAGPGQFNLAAGQPQCGGTFAFNGTGTSPAISCSSNGHTNYSPGGSY